MLEPVLEEDCKNRNDSNSKDDYNRNRKLAERMALLGTRIDVASVSKKTRGEAVSTRPNSTKLTASNDTSESSSLKTRSRSKQQPLPHIPSSTYMPSGVPASPPKTPKRLTPQMMLDQLQTIQTEERVRSIKRRESLLHEAGTLNLLPSPVDDDASTPGTQSLSHDINFPPTPTDDDTPTPVDPPTSTADDEAHTTSATLNPYAACTPAELILGKAKVSNAILEFNDILEGLGGIVLRQQQLVTNSPLNAELLSLQERLSRVQSIAVTEHGLMAEESQARAQAVDIQLQKREQGVIIKTSVGPDAVRPTDPNAGMRQVREDTNERRSPELHSRESSLSSPSSRVSGNGILGSRR